MFDYIDDPNTILVYISGDNENHVKFLTYDKPLDYVYYGISHHKGLDVGMLNDLNLNSFEEFKEQKRIKFNKNLEADVKEILSDGYYEGTQGLAREFRHLAKEYLKEHDELKLQGLDMLKLEPHLPPFAQFNDEYAFLRKGHRAILDVRFRIVTETLRGLIDGEPFEEVVAKEPKLYSKEEFIKAVNEEAEKFKVIFENNLNETFKTITNDYEDLKRLAKKYLNEHDKVGLIGYDTTFIEEEINDLSLDEFGVDGFLKVKPNTIYWFTK